MTWRTEHALWKVDKTSHNKHWARIQAWQHLRMTHFAAGIVNYSKDYRQSAYREGQVSYAVHVRVKPKPWHYHMTRMYPILVGTIIWSREHSKVIINLSLCILHGMLTLSKVGSILDMDEDHTEMSLGVAWKKILNCPWKSPSKVVFGITNLTKKNDTWFPLLLKNIGVLWRIHKVEILGVTSWEDCCGEKRLAIPFCTVEVL